MDNYLLVVQNGRTYLTGNIRFTCGHILPIKRDVGDDFITMLDICEEVRDMEAGPCSSCDEEMAADLYNMTNDVHSASGHLQQKEENNG